MAANPQSPQGGTPPPLEPRANTNSLPAATPSSTTRFRYDLSALPSAATHIRLLELYPSKPVGQSYSDEDHFLSDLECRLSTTPIDSPQPFKALSYTWGLGGATHSIQLAGAGFLITETLDTALRHLRKRYGACTLWIDQICINQSDPAEKSPQVRLMDRIYSRAGEVLVWLGPSANDSDTLMDAWQTLGQEALRLGLDSFYTKERIALLLPIINNDNPADKTNMKFQALFDRSMTVIPSLMEPVKHWFERPWFKRVWVVQEFCLCAKTVFVCGPKMVPTDLVMMAVQILQFGTGKLFREISLSEEPVQGGLYEELRQFAINIYSEPTGVLFSARSRRRAFDRGAGTGDELFHLLKKLYMSHEMQATMYCDRIYGLLGLAVDTNRLDIEPDYTITKASPVLTQTAKALIRNGRIEVLSFSQPPKLFDDLPSWVPDWRSKLQTPFYNINENADKHLFDAAEGTEVGFVPATDPILGLRGYMVDTIEEIGSPWEYVERSHSSYLPCLSQVKHLCQLSKLKDQPIYDEPRRREQALWRVPIGDLYWTPADGTRRASEDVATAYRQCLASWDESDLHGLTSEELKARREEWDDKLRSRQVGQDYRHSMEALSNKCPYMTHKGYLGMGPPGTRPGDVVVVFRGGRIPYVLRPLPGRFRYSFVGEAYCDGIMDGEITRRSAQQTFFVI
ncbi:hypothetical protein ACJ41O_006771 [Fusarium nematophilum]